MAKQRKNIHSEQTNDYMNRSLVNRFGTFCKATMNGVGYFMSLGDTQADAEDKMRQLSSELRANDAGAKFDYVLGDTQPLIDAINASILPFMDAAAKAYLTGELTG
ncbi:MAG: hypothetical protein GTO02_10510 [Candidatus Dadabacteria bacterium]|nr:hypothetical protein [Candidatus Dadabacteria bacterium]